jgi:segregation and condensation protein B
MNNIEEKVSTLEAILFAYGDPINQDKLSEASGIEIESLPKFIKLLEDRYENCNSSLRVIKLGDCYQLATRLEYSGPIKAAIESKKNATLSPAAMEVLTIVAYNQPVTKSFVEHVRGVDSSYVVNSLVEKDLLEEAGRLDVPGRPIAYRTTNTFLRCFKLSSLDDLPPLPNHNEQVSFNDINDEEETATV